MPDTIPADSTTQPPEPAFELKESRRVWIFIAALATVFMTAIEGTIVATAMPTIVGALGGFALLSWVFTAYLLTQAVTIPLYGRLADIYGRRPILFLGIGLFLLGSLLCGLAWSMLSLVAFRVLQGIGAGAVMPVGRTLIGDVYHGAERARMQGYVSGVFVGAAVLGPILGAVLVAHTIWQMVFWVNLPFGIAAALMLALSYRERLQRRRHSLDYPGSALLALGTGLLMCALAELSRLEGLTILGLIAASAILLLLFLRHERRAAEPIFPTTLWRNPIVSSGNLVNIACGAATMGVTAFLPAYMQGVMGHSAMVAGATLTAMSAVSPIGALTTGRIILRASYRSAAVAGSFILALGSVMLAQLDPAQGPALAILGVMLLGFGMGMNHNCYMVAVQAGVDWSQRGIATSAIIFSRIFGQAVGAAAFGGIINAGLAGHMAGGGDRVSRIMEPSLRQSLPPAEIAQLMQAFAQALHEVYVVGVVLALIVLTLGLLLPRGLGLATERQ